MALASFVGPSYNLDSRPASVQRTVNMMPVPIEPGNERAGWVLKDVPGLVTFEPPPAAQKLYWEVLVQAEDSSASDPTYWVGMGNSSFVPASGSPSAGNFWGVRIDGHLVFASTTSNILGNVPYTGGPPAWSTDGSVLMFAADFTTGKLWIGRGGSWFGADPAAGTLAPITGLPSGVAPQITYAIALPNAVFVLRTNSGQFTYAPPAGFAPASSNTPIGWHSASKAAQWVISGADSTTATLNTVNSGIPPPPLGIRAARYLP